VHRDLKPSNVLVTKAGVKLLDFGLAKCTRLPAETDQTLTRALTQEGSILGTLQYMAPEQLEGQEADVRSDIFSFGAVLYEMATGKRAFEGKSQASVIGNILRGEPPPVSAVQPGSPAPLDRIIKRCLAKDPEERWQSARDLGIELREMTDASPAEKPPASAARWWKAAAVAAALVSLFSWALYLRRESTPTTRSFRFRVLPPQGNQLHFGNYRTSMISPDGRRLAFLATSKDGRRLVWVRSLDSTEPYPLPGTEGGMGIFWSADSRELGFFSGSKLKKVDASGGVPQPLCDASAEAAGTWAADGTIVIGNMGHGLMRIPSSGGVPTAVTRLDETRGEIGHRSPAFLPDGKHILYRTETKSGSAGVYVGSLDGKPPKEIHIQALDLQSGNRLAAPIFRFGGGYLLFPRGAAMMAQRFNAQRLQPEDEPFQVAPSANVLSASISENGVLAFTEAPGVPGEVLMVDRKGNRLASLGPKDGGLSFHHIEVSPDDKRLAVDRLQMGASDVWSIDIGREVATRLTFGTTGMGPAWSFEGSKIFFNKGDFIAGLQANGSGQPETVARQQAHHIHASADGKLLAFDLGGNPGASRIWILALDGQQKAYPLFNGPAREADPRFSPDGRWIAYDSMESGRDEVYVQSFPPGKGKWMVSRNGGSQPRWRRDGRELYYLEGGGNIMSVEVSIRGGAFEAGIPKVLMEPRLLREGFEAPRFAATSDGQRFFFTSPVGESATVITVVVNWLAPLK
jgi:Tol biopolymer transport system component